MSSFAERKAYRVEHFEKYVRGWKLVECTACSGSGRYKAGACGCCDGTGKMRTAPSKLAQQVASAQAELATWQQERRDGVQLAGSSEPTRRSLCRKD